MTHTETKDYQTILNRMHRDAAATVGSDDSPTFLTTTPASSHERRLALIMIVVSIVAFAIAVPFANEQLMAVPAFMPIYETAIVITDLVTAVMLFGQFRILHARGLLILASGYVFTALFTIVHVLSFPGLFAPGGVIGGGPQTTAWLYCFWHLGFPLFVIGYAIANGTGHGEPAAKPLRIPVRAAIVLSIAAVAVVVTGFTLLTTVGHDLLPKTMNKDGYTPITFFVMASTWAFSFFGAYAMWRRRPHTVLDLWLMVVMCAWIFDIALSAVFNHGRYDLGFYVGRLYGLFAASFVLFALLLEHGHLYARLVDTNQRVRQKTSDLQRLSAQIEMVNVMLAEKNRALQQSSQLKSDFLANMSHELRTPLNAIIGYSEALKDGFLGKLAPAHEEHVTQIFDSGQHLLSLINDILDLSKVEAGKMTLDLEDTALDDTLHACLSIVAERAMRRGITLKFNGELKDQRIMVDVRKLKQIAFNLLSNAVKFTPDRGEVCLSARRVKRNEIGFTDIGDMATRYLPLTSIQFDDFVELRVSDNGVGINADDLPKLFSTFQQLDSSLSRQHDGTGLGLALVSRLAELHGGTVGVASAPKRGTHFAVWLPWRSASGR